MEKTLIVLNGNPRGGEKTWHSMYDNLLEPYNADLALCFGYREDKSLSLYSKAKYIWEVPEYEKWEDYYLENIGEGPWQKSFNLGSHTGFSGLYGTVGSGAIYCAFLHYVYEYKKDILKSYDRIIMTRADQYYAQKQPILPNEYFWLPSGDGYGGLNDRFHIFPSQDIDYVIGVVSNYINTKSFFEDFQYYPNLNLESTYLNYFKRTGYIDKVRTFPRVQFLVRTKLDSTRWGSGQSTVPYNDDLIIKYDDEFEEAMKHIPQEKVFEIFAAYKKYGQ